VSEAWPSWCWTQMSGSPQASQDAAESARGAAGSTSSALTRRPLWTARRSRPRCSAARRAPRRRRGRRWPSGAWRGARRRPGVRPVADPKPTSISGAARVPRSDPSFTTSAAWLGVGGLRREAILDVGAGRITRTARPRPADKPQWARQASTSEGDSPAQRLARGPSRAPVHPHLLPQAGRLPRLPQQGLTEPRGIRESALSCSPVGASELFAT
jgi:hypothetical protein